MIASNRLGAAIAISSLSLAMFGCGGSGGSSNIYPEMVEIGHVAKLIL